MATRKTWAEKMKTPAAPEVKRTEKAFTDIPEHSLMLIPTPVIIDAYIKQIPKKAVPWMLQRCAMTSPLSIMQPKPAPNNRDIFTHCC